MLITNFSDTYKSSNSRCLYSYLHYWAILLNFAKELHYCQLTNCLSNMRKLLLSAIMLFLFVHAFCAQPSGSLPVIYINTDGGQDITSKDYYIAATYYVDANGVEGYENIGSAEAPLTLQIKGRGNYTWTSFDKKPYRLKLDAKASLLGMKKNKHFALLANADDDLGFLRNTVGFEVSRRLGLEYTPAQEPCELVLNGEYMGLYFLTEHIRVDSDRVNVTEQMDNETVAENITGGWLVEIDNYDEDAQVRITDGNGEIMRFTYKSPEILSQQQEEYLTNLVTSANEAIFQEDKTSKDWQNYIDIDELAKFYIVQEVTDNGESFHGSCYWHKERGENTKMMFGPVWDFGNSFRRGTDSFIYYSNFHQHWIGEIAKYPDFQEAVKRHWETFMESYGTLDGFIDDFVGKVSEAASSDYERWQQYGNSNMAQARNSYVNKLHAKVQWLDNQWRGTDIVQTYFICGASDALGAWQPASAPQFAYDSRTETYTVSLDYVDKLNNGFKILGQQSWGGIEYGSNGEYIEFGTDYKVGITTNGNIMFGTQTSLSDVTITLRESEDDVIIKFSHTDTDGIECAADSEDVEVKAMDGMLYVSTTKPSRLEAYSCGGGKVVDCKIMGHHSVALPSGLYIVKADGKVRKVMVR